MYESADNMTHDYGHMDEFSSIDLVCETLAT